jgi:uncharacterized protein (TIGR01777 family)
MKIILAGGTGLLGRLLAEDLSAKGHAITVLSRQPENKHSQWESVQWDGFSSGGWTQVLDGADVLINLAGKSVNCRYHRKNRQELYDSRIFSTLALGKAMTRANRPPALWLQSSTATIYPHRLQGAHSEFSQALAEPAPKWNFSEQLARAWEAAAVETCPRKTRLVLMRTAIVMSNRAPGGAFRKMAGMARWGLGGRICSGRQGVAWIHARDYLRAVNWLFQAPLCGAVNLSAPDLLSQAEFFRIICEQLRQPLAFPTPRWLLELGMWVFHSESELLLKSRRVLPTRLLESGFRFEFPTWQLAAQNLLGK